jgi:hypothetical protein
MRFAAIADVHGNHLALEAVLADIRARHHRHRRSRRHGERAARCAQDHGYADGARCRHVRGNHDRWLIDRPVEKMGSWERPPLRKLDSRHLDWLRTVPMTRVYRDRGLSLPRDAHGR